MQRRDTPTDRTQDRAAGAPDERKLGIGHVLVVEDDPVLALAVEDALSEAGAKAVTIVASTAGAISELRDGSFDTVVLDVHLSDSGDGWAIAELIRALGANAPKVVFATGAPQDIPQDIADLGPVLEKPYDFDDLVAHVAQRPWRRRLLSRLRRD